MFALKTTLCSVEREVKISMYPYCNFKVAYGWTKICFFSRGYAKRRNDYLLGDRLCKCFTDSDVNFWPRTWRVIRRRYKFYGCGDVSVTTAQPTRSKNCYKS